MTEFKSQRIKAALKERLKKRGLTYEDLAEHLEVSVPTVKRYLGPEEMTVSRLLQICEFVDLELEELAKVIEVGGLEEERFSDEQDKFLAKNPRYFAYFMRLCEGLSPAQIAEKHNLTQRSTDKYLIGLEKVDLIRVTGRMRVKPAFKRTPSLGRGALAKVYFENFINTASRLFIDLIHQSFLKKEAGPKERSIRYAVQGTKMSKASYLKWQQELEKNMRAIQETSSIEEKTLPESELETAVFVLAHALVETDNPILKPLNNTFGEISNL